jgi:hypothetical protein
MQGLLVLQLLLVVLAQQSMLVQLDLQQQQHLLEQQVQLLMQEVQVLQLLPEVLVQQ